MHTVATFDAAIGAALLGLGCAVSPAGPAKRDDSPIARCSGPACSKVATPVAGPDVRLTDGTTPFTVQGAYPIELPGSPLDGTVSTAADHHRQHPLPSSHMAT